jgi:glutamine amidotransferase-like uncharacterized protein
LIAERTSTHVYAGIGSSHSWTWLADLFEARGFHDVRFLDSDGFKEHMTDDVRSIIISGGDGFRIASAIGPHGFAHMKGFIHRGGTYVGVCAGAYLPLPSSIEPFNRFNVSTTRIENIDCQVSVPASPRFAVSYGSCSIIHPVRGEIELDGLEPVRAPIFGGPVFKEPAKDQVLLRYARFTGSTEFQLDKDRAAAIVIGRPAAVRAQHGLGELVLLGPHLEHPKYASANDLFLRLPNAGFGEASFGVKSTHDPDVADKDLMRAIADLKVSILGLENRSFLVGNKLWDGSRFLELLTAIENRAYTAEGPTASGIVDLLSRARADIMSASDEQFEYADEGPELLVEAARRCVDNHFKFLTKSR